MRLAALVESPSHVCCRYRLDAFRPRLAEYGHSLDLHSLPRGWWERLGIGKPFVGADAVILQRKLLSNIEAGRLRRRVRRLIFDFDDAVWLRDSFSKKGLHDSRRSRRLANILQQCDAVSAGNSFLAEQAAIWAPHCPIHIIPTCVDTSRYSLADHNRPPGQATLVWIGSSSTLRGLEAVQPRLERIGTENPGVRLKLICDRFLRLQHLRVLPCPWSEPNEAAEIAASDIGISWIPDDAWSRGKCGLKLLQYMAGGLPVVANPVGVQADMIEHGENGFLAETEQEWVEAIRTLANEPGLRRAMGQAGRRLVEKQFSVEAGANHWAALIADLGEERMAA